MLGWILKGFRNLLMSVSQSLVGMLIGIAAEQELIDVATSPARYVPELAGSAYADATVRHVLDMTASVAFNADYDDPRSKIQRQDRAVGWLAAS